MEIIFKDPPINLPGIRQRLAIFGYPEAIVSVHYRDDRSEGVRVSNIPMACRHRVVCAAVDGARTDYEKKIRREVRSKRAKK